MSILSTDTAAPSGSRLKGGPSSGYDLRPSRGLFDLELGDVWRARELLFVLMMRDVQVLYRQAILGVAWAIIQPVFAVIIFTIVFGHFAKIASDGLPYSVFAFAGVLIWTYFSESVRRSATALVTDAELVRKIYFPRLIIPLGSVIAPLIEFSIGFVILLLLMMWHGLYPSWHILAIPPLLLVAGALALSMGLWLVECPLPGHQAHAAVYAANLDVRISHRLPAEHRSAGMALGLFAQSNGGRHRRFSLGSLRPGPVGLHQLGD